MADEKKDTKALDEVINSLAPFLINLDYQNKLSRNEAKGLRELLHLKYEYGQLTSFKCLRPDCDKPLMLTFANGPSCYECRTMGTDLLYFPEKKLAA